jgi:ATP-dependent protease HslVU (ClpYQ) peptidase subunit
MTTIAFRDGVMAADSAAVMGDTIVHRMKKIQRMPNGALAGFAGDVEQALALLDWLRDGQRGRKPKSKDVALIYVTPSGKILHYNGGRKAHPIAEPYYAIGTGKDVAFGAMYAGADAKTAVRAAIKRDTHSRGPVQVMAL